MGNKEKGKAEQALRDAQSRLPALTKELDAKSEKLAETSAACRQVRSLNTFVRPLKCTHLLRAQMEQRIFALSNDANRLRTQYNACDNEILVSSSRLSVSPFNGFV